MYKESVCACVAVGVLFSVNSSTCLAQVSFFLRYMFDDSDGEVCRGKWWTRPPCQFLPWYQSYHASVMQGRKSTPGFQGHVHCWTFTCSCIEGGCSNAVHTYMGVSSTDLCAASLWACTMNQCITHTVNWYLFCILYSLFMGFSIGMEPVFHILCVLNGILLK